MPTTPRARLVYGAADGTATTTPPDGALVLSCQGYPMTRLFFDPPGAGKSYVYTVATRMAARDGVSASSWMDIPEASETVSGTAGKYLTIAGDYDELRITLSSLSGTPDIRIAAYHTGS